MTAHANPSQKNPLAAIDLQNPAASPELPEARAASVQALQAFNNDFLNTIFFNPQGNPQSVASFDARTSNNNVNAVNSDGSLNLDPADLYRRTETKTATALADAADPDTSVAKLQIDESRLERSVAADLNAAALYTGMGKIGKATRLKWAANDAEQAISNIEFAEQLRRQQSI